MLHDVATPTLPDKAQQRSPSQRRPGTGFRRSRVNRCSAWRPFSAECSGRPSGISGNLPDQAPAPSGPEQVTPLRVFVVVINRVDDAVGSEAAKILAQLAPCREDSHRLVIADCVRPDGALAVPATLVAIAPGGLLALVNLRAR